MLSAGVPLTTHDRLFSWLLGTTTGRALLAIAIVVLGWYLSKLVVRLIGRRVARRFRRPSLTRTILGGVRLVVVLAAVAIAANVMGVDRGDIVLSVTVISAVVGIILAPIARNVINGLFVMADRPYEVGDMVEIVDIEERGFVDNITLRYTKIFTMGNSFLVLANSTIRERDILNYSAEDERTREDLTLMISYESDLEEARRIVVRAARDVDGVIDGGPDIRIGSARYAAGPRCLIDEYADHGIVLRLQYWVQQPYYLNRVRSAINERIWNEFADADVEIPYPHSHLVFDETSGRMRVALEDVTFEDSGESSDGVYEPSSPYMTDAERDVTDAGRDVTDAGRDVTDAGRDVTDAGRDVSDAEHDLSDTERDE